MSFSKSKLIVIIDYIYQTEQDKIVNKHIEQVYYNSRSRDIKLWKFIQQHWKKRSQGAYLKYTIIDKFIFDGKKQERNKSIHRLYKVIRNFLLTKQIRDDDLLDDWLFLQSLSNEENPIYNLIIETIDKKIKERHDKDKNALYYFLAYQFYRSQYKNKVANILVNEHDSLSKAKEYLDYLYRSELEEIDTEIAEIEDVNKIKNKPKESNEQKVDLIPDLIKERIQGYDENTTSEEFLPFFEDIMEREATREKKAEYLVLFINHLYLLMLQTNKDLLQVNWDRFVEYGFEKQLFFQKGHLNLQHFLNILSFVSVMDEETTNRHDYIVKRYLKKLSKTDFKIGNLIAQLYKARKLGQHKKVIKLIKGTPILNKGQFFIKIRTYYFLIRSTYVVRTVNVNKQNNTIKESLTDTRKALYQYKQYLNNTKGYENIVLRNLLFVESTIKLLNAKTIKDLNTVRSFVYDNGVVYKKWLYEIIDEKIDTINQGFTFK